MSEYQYYEFSTVDKALNEKEMQSLRNLSSRARITPTSFVNEYHYGDFKGIPLKLVEKYFDAFLYVANWGTRWLMFKLPRHLVDVDLVNQYCLGDSATIHEKGDDLIFEFTSEADDYEWEEGEGWLSSLISLRADILNGDYRLLYLAWLFCVQMEEIEYVELEPPVPPNLAKLNAPLKTFVDFMRIDTDLVAVASENSISEDRHTDPKALKAWIHNLPAKEKDDILFRLVEAPSTYLGAELKRRFWQTSSAEASLESEKHVRKVVDLISKAETYAEERKRHAAEKKAKERARKKREMAIAREKYLKSLAGQENSIWEKVAKLIDSKQPKKYDEAVNLLVDLRDLSKKTGKEKAFNAKVETICQNHYRKATFLNRLKKTGLRG